MRPRRAQGCTMGARSLAKVNLPSLAPPHARPKGGPQGDDSTAATAVPVDGRAGASRGLSAGPEGFFCDDLRAPADI